MLGAFGVGKSSLVRKYVHNIFKEDYLTTIGVQIYQKNVKLSSPKNGKEKNINMILWDMAHIEKFDKTIKAQLMGASAAVLTFDLSRPQTFNDLEEHIKKFLDVNPHGKLIFSANKIDLVERNKLKMEQFLHLSEQYKTDCLTTSAKTGENVEKMFSLLAGSL